VIYILNTYITKFCYQFFSLVFIIFVHKFSIFKIQLTIQPYDVNFISTKKLKPQGKIKNVIVFKNPYENKTLNVLDDNRIILLEF